MEDSRNYLNLYRASCALTRNPNAQFSKNSQSHPPTTEETKTRLPAVMSLLEPRIPQKECSKRNGARIKGPTPTPSLSPHPQPRRRRGPVPAEAPTAQPPLPRRQLVVATRQRPRSIPGPGNSHRQATPDCDYPPYMPSCKPSCKRKHSANLRERIWVAHVLHLVHLVLYF